MSQNRGSDPTSAYRLVDHFFRHEYGRILGRLVRTVGAVHWELAEDAVQNAMQQALRSWGPRGIPDDPGGWLYRVAYHSALDSLRRSKRHQSFLDSQDGEIDRWETNPNRHDDGPTQDDRLRMLFLCCDPSLPANAQLALTLKLAAGFGLSEISRALLTSESTIQKRITRAKEKLREQEPRNELRSESDWADRVPVVLQTIYLLFNEGYFSLGTDHVLRKDMCDEAIRLALLLDSTPFGSIPSTYALLSLMYFHSARFDSRQNDENSIVLLEDQDRSQWDWSVIRKGMTWLLRSASGRQFSRYHIEASIAWEHCRAPNIEQTDWSKIGEMYQLLANSGLSSSGLIGLAMAEYFSKGAEAAFERLGQVASRSSGTSQDIAASETLKGWIYQRMNENERAKECYLNALSIATGPAQQSAIRRLIDKCNSR